MDGWGASLNPTGYAEDVTDPSEGIHELLHVFNRTVEALSRIDVLKLNDAGFAPPYILDGVYSNLPSQMKHDTISLASCRLR